MSVLGILKNEKDAQSFAAGQTIFERGEPGACMYYILQGEVEIRFDGKTLSTRGPEEVFGEMALIDKSPRSASAVAKTDCQLAAVGEKRFLFLVQQHPFFALELMRVLADRVRRRTSA